MSNFPKKITPSFEKVAKRSIKTSKVSQETIDSLVEIVKENKDLEAAYDKKYQLK